MSTTNTMCFLQHAEVGAIEHAVFNAVDKYLEAAGIDSVDIQNKIKTEVTDWVSRKIDKHQDKKPDVWARNATKYVKKKIEEYNLSDHDASTSDASTSDGSPSP